MILVLALVPDLSPTINLFSRTTDSEAPDTSPVNGSPIAGTAITNRPGHFQFSLTGIAAGDYVVVSANPIGTWTIRITATQVLISDTWNDLEQTQITISPLSFNITPSAVSGRNRLTFYNSGEHPITITRTDGQNFDGTSMTFVIERSDGSDLVRVTGLTSLTNSVAVTIPATAYNAGPDKKWSLRKASNDQVILHGPAIMEYVAIED
jgi:hypothetical protein